MKGRASLDCVLLVDDDDITNTINRRIIKKFNIALSIVVAKSGEEALKYILENDAPDLILLDINMPIMNGSEFLEAYLKNFKDSYKIRIIVLSSSVNLDDRFMAASYGVPFLNKPLSGERLLEVIKN